LYIRQSCILAPLLNECGAMRDPDSPSAGSICVTTGRDWCRLALFGFKQIYCLLPLTLPFATRLSRSGIIAAGTSDGAVHILQLIEAPDAASS
jgi:hypothetical protein